MACAMPLYKSIPSPVTSASNNLYSHIVRSEYDEHNVPTQKLISPSNELILISLEESEYDMHHVPTQKLISRSNKHAALTVR